MMVEQYSTRFIELLRFASDLNEEAKIDRFIYGFQPHIREKVVCLDIKEYTKMVDTAALVESYQRSSVKLCIEETVNSSTCVIIKETSHRR